MKPAQGFQDSQELRCPMDRSYSWQEGKGRGVLWAEGPAGGGGERGTAGRTGSAGV